jgi:hypothetical protein
MYELFQLNTDWKEERNIWNELPERDRATLRARLLDSERERLKFDPE